MIRVLLVVVFGLLLLSGTNGYAQPADTLPAKELSIATARNLVAKYCVDCHDAASKEADLDLTELLSRDAFDGTLVFENVITRRMPPSDAEQPTDTERREILIGLSDASVRASIKPYRRISRYEFNHSASDLLGVQLDVSGEIPEDRGTNVFDSDRRIMLSKEQMSAYFAAADDLLEFALPENGFPVEQSWTTSTIQDSHESYNIYVRDYKDGLLFAWTRANNGNNYSYFYDHFEPPVKGWYDLTFDAAKVGDFDEDVSVLVYAGKYYYADDRPQPQRLLGVLSVGNKELQPYTLRGFLNPGESVSVHCYSLHTWRQQGGNEGAYIKQLNIRGPVLDAWPPTTYRKLFADLPMSVPDRLTHTNQTSNTALQQIGGRVTVSSFQVGMEKEKMLDRSSKTFWHTRFTPDVAIPPHYVILENPKQHEILGLVYSTWSGGNGNGQVKRYEVALSDDGVRWEEPIQQGSLEVMHAAEQEILFPEKTRKPFLRFLVKEAVELDGKSLASIGGLDVILERHETAVKSVPPPQKISIGSNSTHDLQQVVRRFANEAFASELSKDELAPYYAVSLDSFREDGDFINAARQGFKAILCSHRFLLAPGSHRNDSYRIAASLARCLWLSVPDTRLMELAAADDLHGESMSAEIDRMLRDPRARRMIHSFCDQWLNLRSFNKVSPSLKLYPEYNDLLNYYLPQETEDFLFHLIQENLPVTELIDSDFSMLNQRLAQHYGIDGVIGEGMRKVMLPSDSPRGGLLTMGSILKVTSDGFQTSPILRGAWVSKNIAGNTLSPPPESVKAIEPSTNQATTLKEQIEEHKNNATCFACHKSIDPYGFALESFDATGEFRSKYRVEVPHQGTFMYRLEGYFQWGGDVDPSGDVGDSAFEDVNGLKKLLISDHKKVAYNFAKKFFEYANGYEPTLHQRIDLYGMIADSPEDCRLKDLIAKVIMVSYGGENRDVTANDGTTNDGTAHRRNQP